MRYCRVRRDAAPSSSLRLCPNRLWEVLRCALAPRHVCSFTVGTNKHSSTKTAAAMDRAVQCVHGTVSFTACGMSHVPHADVGFGKRAATLFRFKWVPDQFKVVEVSL